MCYHQRLWHERSTNRSWYWSPPAPATKTDEPANNAFDAARDAFPRGSPKRAPSSQRHLRQSRAMVNFFFWFRLRCYNEYWCYYCWRDQYYYWYYECWYCYYWCYYGYVIYFALWQCIVRILVVQSKSTIDNYRSISSITLSQPFLQKKVTFNASYRIVLALLEVPCSIRFWSNTWSLRTFWGGVGVPCVRKVCWACLVWEVSLEDMITYIYHLLACSSCVVRVVGFNAPLLSIWQTQTCYFTSVVQQLSSFDDWSVDWLSHADLFLFIGVRQQPGWFLPIGWWTITVSDAKCDWSTYVVPAWLIDRSVHERDNVRFCSTSSSNNLKNHTRSSIDLLFCTQPYPTYYNTYKQQNCKV